MIKYDQINILFTTNCYHQYLKYLGQQKLSKQHIKQINIKHVTIRIWPVL